MSAIQREELAEWKADAERHPSGQRCNGIHDATPDRRILVLLALLAEKDAKIDSLQRMAKVDAAFHEVAVKERDYYRAKNARLEPEVGRLHDRQNLSYRSMERERDDALARLATVARAYGWDKSTPS